MIIIMPPPPQKYDASAWSSILDFIKRSMIPVISRTEAVDRVLLRAPDGTTYALTVDNSGTISTAVENGNTPS
jgi:hypothetical protein